MKIKSLLAAVSMVAITAGSANALQFTDTSGIAAGVALACELDFAASPVEAFVGFDIQRGTATTSAVVPQFNTGVNTITITLPAGVTFGADATGSSIQAFSSITPATSTPIPATNISSAANSTGGVISGGTAGSNSITYSIDLTDNNSVVLRVPQLAVAIATGTPSGALTANVTTASGAVTDGAPAVNMDILSSTGALMTPGVFTACVPALTTNAVDRDDLGLGLSGSDTQIELAATPPFSSLVDVSGNANGTLGAIEIVRATTTPAVSFTNTAGTAPLASPQLFNFAVNVDSVEFDVVPAAGTSGLASAILQNGIGGPTVATATRSASGFAFDIPYVGALSTGAADAIVVAPNAGAAGTATAPVPIASQAVNVTGFTINLDDSPGVNLVPSIAGANGDLDGLQRQGTTCGVFDWNGQTITNSVYRITGLPAGTTNGSISFTNSVAGAAGNGSYNFSVTSTNGEAVLTSFNNFNTANDDWVRADISMTFEVADSIGENIDVDRLLSRGGVISDFGGGANSTGGSNNGGSSDDDGATCLNSSNAMFP